MQLKEKVLEWVTEYAAEKNVDIADDTDLFECGVLDSFGIIVLISFIIESLGIEIRQEDMIPDNFRSINAICRLLSIDKGDSNV